jgi:hypothetical protein
MIPCPGCANTDTNIIEIADSGNEDDNLHECETCGLQFYGDEVV